MKIIFMLLSATNIVCCGSAIADSVIGKWTCMARDSINNFSEKVNEIEFNNFIVEETESQRFKDLKAINPSFSIVNRTNDEYNFVSELVGMTKNKAPIFATSALSNPFVQINPHSVERAGQGVLIDKGEWDLIDQICVRNSAGKIAK